jgi:multidrug efflux pump subunit AcrB
MKACLGFFIQRPLLVNLSLLLIIAMGAYSLHNAVISAYPQFDFGAFSILTRSPGASPEDVELNITSVLEDEILKIDGIKQLHSNSMTGSSALLIDAKDSVTRDELDDMARDLQRAIDRARGRLPSHLSEPPLLTELKSELEPSIELLVSGNVSEDLLREAADKIQDEMRELDGVAGIDKRSYRSKEVRILIDPMAMHRLGITINEIEQAIRARNITTTGGTIESLNAEKEVIVIGRFAAPKDVANVIIRAPEYGNLVRIKDVAEVVADYEDWTVRAFYNGVPGIYLGVRRAVSASELKVVDHVKRLVGDLNKRLPPGVQLSIANDLSRLTKAMLGSLAYNALAGMGMIFLVLMAFYPWRATCWVVIGIPGTVLLGFALMPLFGLTISQFTLAAIILMLGLLVDDAIVTSESIFRRFEAGRPPRLAATEGTAAVAPAVITGAITTLLAFLPMVFLGGKEGKFMWMLPAMVVLIISASLLECKLMLPAHMAQALGRSPQMARSARWLNRIEAGYRSIISWLIRYRYWALGGFTALLVSIMLITVRLINIDLYPQSDVDIVHVKAALPPGSSFDNTYQELRKVEQLIHRIIGDVDLQNTRLTVGSHDIGLPSEVNPGSQSAWGTIDIMLEPHGTRHIDTTTLVRSLREAFAQLSQFESLRVLPRIVKPAVGYPVEVQVISNNDERGLVAAELLTFLRKHPGVSDAWSSFAPGKDTINLQLKHEIIAAHGLHVADITRAIQVAFDGYIVGELQTLDERIKYRLQFQEPHRGDAAMLHSLTLTNPRGDAIPLRALAEIDIKPGQASINHYFGKRAETIYADIDRDQISLVEINTQLANHMRQQQYEQRYPGLRIRQGGELQSQQATTANMAGALLIALMAIFFVMVLLFNSLTQPLIVIAMIPMGFAGVMLAFVAQGYDLSVPAMIGLLGLAGVLVNSAIVMIDRLNQYRNHQGLVDAQQIVEGASLRLRPILITSLTSVAGLAPAAYGWLGSNPFLTPMIMAMLWGIAFGTVVTLLYLPCLYAVDQDVRRLMGKVSAISKPLPGNDDETADRKLPAQA